jgi:hypothetical protein
MALKDSPIIGRIKKYSISHKGEVQKFGFVGMGNGPWGIEKNILLVLKRIFFLKNNSKIPYSQFPIPEQKKCPSLYLISQRNAIGCTHSPLPLFKVRILV